MRMGTQLHFVVREVTVMIEVSSPANFIASRSVGIQATPRPHLHEAPNTTTLQLSSIGVRNLLQVVSWALSC